MGNENNSIDNFEVNLTDIFDKADDVDETIWFSDTETLYDRILEEVKDLVETMIKQREQKVNDLITKAKRDAKKEVFNDIEKIENSNGNHLLNQIDLDNQMKYEELKQRHLPKEEKKCLDCSVTGYFKDWHNDCDEKCKTCNGTGKKEEEKKY